MSDILSNVLKVNQPISGGVDNHSAKNLQSASGDPQIHNIVDPTKVVRTDHKGEAENQQFAFNSESNYENFIQTLRSMPSLTEVFSKFLFTDLQTVITSGISENFAEEISAFLEMIQMEPEQLLSFIKNQNADSGQFGGVFFQTLRDILNGSSSIELRTGILSFIKNYSNMQSAPHMLKNIQTSINQMMPYLFRSDAEQLQEIVGHLVNGELPEQGAAGENPDSLLNHLDAQIKENARVLKEELIPFFSKYVMRTRDLGRPRELMTFITINTARYCNATKEGVIQSFEKLLQFSEFNRKLGTIKADNLEHILDRLLAERKNGQENPWAEKFINMLRSGLDGAGGYESKGVFQNVLNALLMNESVYMPLVHLMLPLELNGTTMFSEMWIDPDAGGDEEGQKERTERNIRMLVKFDIKDVGYFDLVLNYQGGNVDMVLCYPSKLSAAEQEIKKGLGRIIQDNGLNSQSLSLEQSRIPLSVSEVFPKIKEGRNSINVRI